MKKTWKDRSYYLLSILSLAIFIGLWFMVAVKDGSMIPTPVEMFQRLLEIQKEPVSNTPLIIHVVVSLRRVMIAFLAAVVLGISLGVGLGWFPAFRKVVGPIFEMLRPIPPIAWIPLVILWCGIGELPKIVIVFIGSFIPIVLNTFSGIAMVDPLLINAGRVLGANNSQLLQEIVLPDCIPAILAGMKSALSSGWMCVLAAEMIVAKQGVGFLIVTGQENNDSALIIISMITIALVSAMISFLLTKLERMFCPWQYQSAK